MDQFARLFQLVSMVMMLVIMQAHVGRSQPPLDIPPVNVNGIMDCIMQEPDCPEYNGRQFATKDSRWMIVDEKLWNNATECDIHRFVCLVDPVTQACNNKRCEVAVVVGSIKPVCEPLNLCSDISI